ncbi:hypothetical protein [Tsuneonella mangrovi]|uniref:hypothetical protein n=1 Tax=Tsuneonella mangrovi TaxID=1982042 RepID=UPI000BA1FAC8|nr:hypothetical protein [Tsuneonella mangrovi]
MRSITEIEQWLNSGERVPTALGHAEQLLVAGEEVLENWILAHGGKPTRDTREGFRLLALHRQGAKGDPSFNACRETCRELAYHYNLIRYAENADNDATTIAMMRLVTKHLVLFIGGKLQEAGLGDFCCSSRPRRMTPDDTVEPLGADHA